MKHQLIKQIHKDKKLVLCVVIGVITTADKAEIIRTDNKSGNIEVVEKINLFFFSNVTQFRYIVTLKYSVIMISTGPLAFFSVLVRTAVKPVLRGHLWNKEKWALKDKSPLKFSMTGQEKGQV